MSEIEPDTGGKLKKKESNCSVDHQNAVHHATRWSAYVDKLTLC